MTIKQHLKILRKVRNYKRYVLIDSQSNCIKFISCSATRMLTYAKHSKLLNKEVNKLIVKYNGNYIYYRENKGE